MGELRAIWIKRIKGGPMDETESATLVAGRGIEGNADQGTRRQVTVISADSWNDVEAVVGHPVEPSTRRANLLVEGVDLVESRGKLLVIDGSVVRLLGETRPCRQMEESCRGLLVALLPDWRGGAYGEIVTGGPISVGDSVELHQTDSIGRLAPLRDPQDA